MNIKKAISDFAEEKNIVVGVCSAERFEYLENADISVPFVDYSREERIDPSLAMPSVKSIIVIGVGNRKKENFSKDSEIRGVFSTGSFGTDYHITVSSVLDELRERLSRYADFEYKRFVDTGPLVERELARKVGIGWVGKSKNLVSEKFGSFFNIGYMLVDLDIEPDIGFEAGYTKCGDCRACMIACPAGAIKPEGFYFEKCVSFLTQTKKSLTKEQMSNMGISLYGCDICQSVCKYNDGKYCLDKADDIDIAKPKLYDILRLTNKGFKEKYSKTAIGWRGNKILKRNAVIACVNQGGAHILKEFDVEQWKYDNILRCAIEYAEAKKQTISMYNPPD